MQSKHHGRGQQWQKLRAEGWRRCIGRVTAKDSMARVDARGFRHKARKTGTQCEHWVHPEQLADRGLPLCTAHHKRFLEDAEKDVETRARLRAKYDPGPLPLEGE